MSGVVISAEYITSSGLSSCEVLAFLACLGVVCVFFLFSRLCNSGISKTSSRALEISRVRAPSFDLCFVALLSAILPRVTTRD